LKNFKDCKNLVFKIGTSTITHENGKLNLHKIEKIIRVIADIKNSGKTVVVVTSGAIGVGVGKLNLSSKPKDIGGRQACAAIGQCELMYLYDKFFLENNCITGQVLMTRDIVDDEKRLKNVKNAFIKLIDFGAIPVVNENDCVSTEELEFGDNDALSAMVAKIVNSDGLIMLTDINGLYTGDPKKNPDSQLIKVVEKITEDTKKIASGRGSSRGTGGMITKIAAAEIAVNAGIITAIVDGAAPESIYDLLEGKEVGTIFWTD
jgi:glutamate 5-kinase